MTSSPPDLAAIKEGGKRELARTLTMIEEAPLARHCAALLDEAWQAGKERAHVIGLTGPPGVGKSTLSGALVTAFRGQGKSVAILAVDPSSLISGGALLGDRARLVRPAGDAGSFMRSMAARGRLGGLSDNVFPALVLLRAIFDVVLIETVGVGQSEIDIADHADSVVFCIQPASGDALQFMKAGLMEVPHFALITKADLGVVAERAAADAKAALALYPERSDGWTRQVLKCAVSDPQSIAYLASALEEHLAWLRQQNRLLSIREGQLDTRLSALWQHAFGAEMLKIRTPTVSLNEPFSHFLKIFSESSKLMAKLAKSVRMEQFG